MFCLDLVNKKYYRSHW